MQKKNKVALLACGPSLKDNYCVNYRCLYDYVIAINGACMIFPADYFSFLDCNVQENLAEQNIKPNIGYRTHLKTGDDLPKEKPKLYGMKKHDLSGFYKDELEVVDYANNCCNYTFPCTLHFAQELANGGEIDLYGFDCINELDCFGFSGTRKPCRWCRELPWVKYNWGNNVIVKNSYVDPSILLWLESRISWREMLKKLQWTHIEKL